MSTDAEKLAAAEAVAELDLFVLVDKAGSFTCHEAETIATFLRAFSCDVESFLLSHAFGDDDRLDIHEVVRDEHNRVTGWKYREETNA